MNGRQEEAAGAVSQSLGQRFAGAATVEASMPEPSSRPFSIRLSASERQRLEEAAASVPLGSHIRARLLGASTAKTPRRAKSDSVALGQILAMLGRSRLSAAVADLAAAARAGTIVLTPEMEAQVAALSKEVVEVRRLLMRSLGLVTEGAP